MKKSDVNGDNTNEVYKWLKSQKSGLLGLTRIKVRIPTYLIITFAWTQPHPQWNFEKFLVDKNGNVVERWASVTTPDAIDAQVAKII
jgi:peroxiredoxin